MDDRIYDYSLTVKVRLPAEGKDVQANQEGNPCAVRVVEHSGARYALIAAVPNRGRCVVNLR